MKKKIFAVSDIHGEYEILIKGLKEPTTFGAFMMIIRSQYYPYLKTYFELHAEELLKQAGLNKARFAEQMGVARQNIQKTFETKNVFTLMRAAEILNVPLPLLIYGEETKSSIDGFVEVNGTTYRLKSREDIEDILLKI